jgi:hypothetical protein
MLKDFNLFYPDIGQDKSLKLITTLFNSSNSSWVIIKWLKLRHEKDIAVEGPSINYVTALGGGGGIKEFVTTVLKPYH